MLIISKYCIILIEGGFMVFKGVRKVTNLRTIEEAEKIIDKVFKGLGLKPEEAKIDSKDILGWAVKRGRGIKRGVPWVPLGSKSLPLSPRPEEKPWNTVTTPP